MKGTLLKDKRYSDGVVLPAGTVVEIVDDDSFHCDIIGVLNGVPYDFNKGELQMDLLLT